MASPNVRSAPIGQSEQKIGVEDAENIPYHAREYARPFTYGNLPAGFKTSDLNHVAIEEVLDEPKPVRAQTVLPPSPSVLRKSTRPSISPSRPVLRKTPTRQEFEEMLNERREQSLREQRTFETQQAQNAAIQKDLDELQQILSENILHKPKQSDVEKVSEGTIDVETIGLPNEVTETQATETSNQEIEHQFSEDRQHEENALQLVEVNRPETPAFPAVNKWSQDERCISPYPMVTPGTPTLQRLHSSGSMIKSISSDGLLSKSSENSHQEVAPHLVKFAKDSSEYWYKPHITREDAIALLRIASPGTFVIRNSTTYKNAFGLVLRVDKPPHGVVINDSSHGDELVRHFLLEPTTRGVRLKGCSNEPTFTSLSALVYEHTINQLALPCKLIIPDSDLLNFAGNSELAAAQKQLLEQGAACNVLYLYSCNTESLTGDEAVRKAVYEMYSSYPLPTPTEVHFKVSQQGITLTDNTRRLFFRRHYTAQNISHCGIDPDNRFWNVSANDEGQHRSVNKTIFAFVARPIAGSNDNQCHVFSDLAANQPASAIVSFANKLLPMDKHNHKML